jgi:hypothetical protein
MTSTTQCNARVAVWASECGFCPPEDYYTVAVQCGKSRVDDDCLCKIHTNDLPFSRQTLSSVVSRPLVIRTKSSNASRSTTLTPTVSRPRSASPTSPANPLFTTSSCPSRSPSTRLLTLTPTTRPLSWNALLHGKPPTTTLRRSR